MEKKDEALDKGQCKGKEMMRKGVRTMQKK